MQLSRKAAPLLGMATLAALGLAAARPATAQTPALTFSNTTGQAFGNGPYTLGFEFTANQNISVTNLGLFDDSQDGLADSHAIGLFNSSGTELTGGTIDSGTTDPLTNQFRYIAVTPVTLQAGQTYFVGALYSGQNSTDNFLYPGDANDFAADPAITFGQATYNGGSTLEFPGNGNGTSPGYFGPNFEFNGAASPAPEPSSVAAFAFTGLGAVGLILKARKRKVTSAA